MEQGLAVVERRDRRTCCEAVRAAGVAQVVICAGVCRR
jgi:hypothetical protein